MFCEKCGSQVADDSKFCLTCGAPVAPQAAPAAAAAPAGPSALAKFFSNKKNVTITAIVSAVVVVAIVVLCIVLSLPTAIYLDDYIEITYEGLDGAGDAYMSVDGEKLLAALEEHMSESDYEVMMTRLDKKGLNFELAKTEELSNGEKIALILEVDNDIAEEYGIVFKLRNDSVTVSGLKDSTPLDLFADLVITYDGFVPYADVRVENTSDNQFIKDYVSYSVSGGYDVQEGSVFTVEAYFSKSEAIEQGYLIKETSREYTATNVPVPVELDLFADLELVYTGCSPVAKVEVVSNSANEFIKEHVRYSIDNKSDLEEGETFTVTASYSSYYAEEYGYTINATTKEYTASNLPEPVTLDVFAHVNVIFTGTEGNGNASYEITTDDEFISRYVRFEFNKSYNLSAGETISLVYSVVSYAEPLKYGYTLGETASQTYTVPALGQKLTDFNQLSSDEQTRLMNAVLTEAEKYLSKEGAAQTSINLYNTGYSSANQLSYATSLSNIKIHSVIVGQQGSWIVTDYLVFVVSVDIVGHPNLTETNGNTTGYFYFYLSSPVAKADSTLENDLENSLRHASYCYKNYEELGTEYLNNINNQVVFTPNA